MKCQEISMGLSIHIIQCSASGAILGYFLICPLVGTESQQKQHSSSTATVVYFSPATKKKLNLRQKTKKQLSSI
jgi:hypothetical protein